MKTDRSREEKKLQLYRGNIVDRVAPIVGFLGTVIPSAISYYYMTLYGMHGWELFRQEIYAGFFVSLVLLTPVALFVWLYRRRMR
jgi:hypothetical protein